MRILSRIVEWTEEGINVEPDQRHAELIVKIMGVSEGKAVVTPGAKEEELHLEVEDDELLDKEMASMCRAVVARAFYLSQDRTDIVYAVKELSRE